jgi:DNA polymerase (family 10)
MADAARARGYAYLAITDHSKRLTVANGLDERRLLEQLDEVDAVNADLRDLVVLKGIEVDILEDGRLDLSDDVLARLDVVVASVHSKFNLSREQQTERILRALDHPHVAILGHPTGRLLLERPGYELDMERIIAHARQRGCFLELNAHPERLDLNDVHARMARDAGVLISIDSDAHSPRDLALAAHGIVQARRAWLGPADVLNTRPLPELRRLLARAMGHPAPA